MAMAGDGARGNAVGWTSSREPERHPKCPEPSNFQSRHHPHHLANEGTSVKEHDRRQPTALAGVKLWRCSEMSDAEDSAKGAIEV